MRVGGCDVHAVELIFAIGWAAFWIYWLVAAFSMKRGRSGVVQRVYAFVFRCSSS